MIVRMTWTRQCQNLIASYKASYTLYAIESTGGLPSTIQSKIVSTPQGGEGYLEGSKENAYLGTHMGGDALSLTREQGITNAAYLDTCTILHAACTSLGGDIVYLTNTLHIPYLSLLFNIGFP